MITLIFKTFRESTPAQNTDVVVLLCHNYGCNLRQATVEYTVLDESGTAYCYDGDVPDGHTLHITLAGIPVNDDMLWMYQDDFQNEVDKRSKQA